MFNLPSEKPFRELPFTKKCALIELKRERREENPDYLYEIFRERERKHWKRVFSICRMRGIKTPMHPTERKIVQRRVRDREEKFEREIHE